MGSFDGFCVSLCFFPVPVDVFAWMKLSNRKLKLKSGPISSHHTFPTKAVYNFESFKSVTHGTTQTRWGGGVHQQKLCPRFSVGTPRI